MRAASLFIFVLISGITDLGLAGEGRPLSASAVLLLLCSGLVILTTIHAQDFADIAGDSALGRVTFPIRAPALSRALIYLGIPLLSLALSVAWDMFWAARVLFLALGSAVAWRFYAFRTISQDARSYVLYNVSRRGLSCCCDVRLRSGCC